jgi:carbon storage regulator
MLVLSRKRGEGVHIRDDIVVTVVDVRGDRVKLGFQCAGDIPIYRDEVYRRVRDEVIRAPAPRPDESQYFAEFA